jgi:hypothetical protein
VFPATTISPDGRKALTETRLWDLGTDKATVLRDTPYGVWNAAFSPTGQLLAVGGASPPIPGVKSRADVVLYDAVRGEKKFLLSDREHLSAAVLGFSPDGKRLLTNGVREKEAFLWDTATGQKVATWTLPDALRSATWSADGKRVLLGLTDGTVVLWSVSQEQALQRLRGHQLAVNSSVFHAGGSRVSTASSDGMVRLWDADTGVELACLFSLNGGTDWLATTPEGLFDGSVNGQKLISYREAGNNTLVPLERYQKRYLYPGLVAALMQGERPKPKVDITRALPPKVRITAPARSGEEVKAAKVTVQAEAESVGEHAVREVRLLLDGRPFQGDTGIRRLSDPRLGSVLVSWDIELAPGKHTLKVLADSAYSQGASDEVSLSYVGGEADAELPRLYVLAIGVARYQDDNLHLDYAARDADAVANAFQTYSKPLYRSVQTRVLTDKDATRAGIIKGLGWLRQEVTQRDVGVVFFSGHGDRDTDGNLFFLPVETDSKDIASTAVPAEQIKKTLLAMPGKVVLILDACHAGGIDKPKKKSARDLTDSLVRDLAAEESGLVVLCSSTGAEFSLESNEHRQGNFTLALVEALSGKAAKTDGAVYLHHLDAYVTDRVKELTRGRQHPVTSKPSTIRSFPLSKP